MRSCSSRASRASERSKGCSGRLAIGSSPRHLLARVLREGLTIVGIGIAAGIGGGYAFGILLAGRNPGVALPGAASIAVAAVLLAIAATMASLLPAARAARVDVLDALRSE